LRTILDDALFQFNEGVHPTYENAIAAALGILTFFATELNGPTCSAELTTPEFDLISRLLGEVEGGYGGFLVIPVPIDVEPDSSNPPTIHLLSFFPLTVDVFTDNTHAAGFDITNLDTSTVVFCNGAPPLHDLTDPTVFALHQFDINGDGKLDLRFHVQHNQCNLPVTAPGLTTTACFNAELIEDEFGVQQEVAGCEDVIVEDNFIFE
jgi:hypothetical protein